MFTREKCKEIQEGTVEEPELEGLTDFVERSKVLAEIWKTMSSEDKHEFEEMGNVAYERKLDEYHNAEEERDADRRKHCRKLSLPLDTSWEGVKKAYDNRASGNNSSGNSSGNSGGGSSSFPPASSGRSIDETRRKRVDASTTNAGSNASYSREANGDAPKRAHGRSALGRRVQAVLRRRAIVRGLDQVFKMSLAEENFNLSETT